MDSHIKSLKLKISSLESQLQRLQHLQSLIYDDELNKIYFNWIQSLLIVQKLSYFCTAFRGYNSDYTPKYIKLPQQKQILYIYPFKYASEFSDYFEPTVLNLGDNLCDYIANSRDSYPLCFTGFNLTKFQPPKELHEIINFEIH